MVSSEGSPTPFYCVLLVSSVICVWAGVYFFHEGHGYRQYVGGVVMLVALVFLTLERTFEIAFVVSVYKNAYFIFSLILAVLACFCVSLGVV